ncbi:hypothetical protein D3C85_1366840 [compost metagenome]
MAVMANTRPRARVVSQGCSGSNNAPQARPQVKGTKKLGRAIFRLWRSTFSSTTSARICPSSRAKLRPYRVFSQDGATSAAPLSCQCGSTQNSISSGRPRVASSNWLTIGISPRRRPSSLAIQNSARARTQNNTILMPPVPCGRWQPRAPGQN